MACSIGAADRRHATVRPVLVRVMRPASASTSRCFMTAGRDMANGSASLETDTSPLSDRRASSARRVGSASAAKVRSRSCNLTMRLSVGRWGGVSRVWFFCRFRGRRGLLRMRFGFFASALASALRCLPFTRRPCAGRHLLFFAAAKKSRQKKAANTASPCSYPRAPNVPTLHMTVPWSVLVANASNERLTRFEYPYSGKRQRMVCAAQVANCV